MLTKENTFYRNLLFLNIGVLLLISERYHGGPFIKPIYLSVVLHFFVLAQFYLDRWSMRLFPIVFLLVNGFYIPYFVKDVKSLLEMGEFFSGHTLGAILILTPAIYAFARFRYWFEEFKEKTVVKLDEIQSKDQNLIELIPLILTAVIGIITFFFHPVFNANYGLQSFHAEVEGKLAVSNLVTNLLSKETFIFIIVLAAIYLARKNIKLGFMLLGIYLFQVFSYHLLHFLNVNFFSFRESESPLFTLTGFLLEAVPVLAACAFYFAYFNRNNTLSNIFGNHREAKLIDRKNRPVVTLSEFVAMHKAKLILESTVLSVSQAIFCIFVMVQSFHEYTPNPVMLIFATLQLVGITLFYLGSRNLKSTTAIIGFVLVVLLPVLLIGFLVENYKAAFGFGPYIVWLIMLNMITMFIWGIPILGALTSEHRFVRFVQNRDYSRMFNQFPEFQFPIKDVNQTEVDMQSQALIPWKKRKVRSIIFLSFAALSFVVTSMYLDLFSSMSVGMSSLVFIQLNIVVSSLLLYAAILKWGLMLNQAIAITYLVIYSISVLASIYSLTEASLVSTGQMVSLVIQLVIIGFFAEILHQLSKQRFADHRSGMLDDDIIEKEI